MAYTITKKPFYKEFTDKPNLINGSWFDYHKTGGQSGTRTTTQVLEKDKTYTLIGYGYGSVVARIRITQGSGSLYLPKGLEPGIAMTVFIPPQTKEYDIELYSYSGTNFWGWAAIIEGNVTGDNGFKWRPTMDEMAAKQSPRIAVSGENDGVGWSAVSPRTLVFDKGAFRLLGGESASGWTESMISAGTTLSPGTYRIGFQYNVRLASTDQHMEIQDGSANMLARMRLDNVGNNIWKNVRCEITIASGTNISFVFYWNNPIPTSGVWFRNFSITDTAREKQSEWLSTFLATGNPNEFILQKNKNAVTAYEAAAGDIPTWKVTCGATFDGQEEEPASIIFDDGTVGAGKITAKTLVSPNYSVTLDIPYREGKVPVSVVCMPVGLYYEGRAEIDGQPLELTLAATPDKRGEARIDVSPILRTLTTRGHEGQYHGADREGKKSGEVTFSFAEVVDNSSSKTWNWEGLYWYYVEAAMPAHKGGNMLEYDPSYGRQAKWLNSFGQPRYTVGSQMDLSVICPKGSDILRVRMNRYAPDGTLLSPVGGDTIKYDVYQAAGAVASLPINKELVTGAVARLTLESLEQEVPVITWPNPSPITTGTALGAAQLNTSANVPGVFSYYPPSGSTLTAGTHRLTCTFFPTDKENYMFVAEERDITVNAKTTPTITWDDPAGITYGAALTGAQLNATASVPGTFVYSPALDTILTAGTKTLSTTFTPTDTVNNNEVTKQVTIIVAKANPVITWAAPSAILYGTALSGTQLNATCNVPGTLVYSPALGAVLGGGVQTLAVAFTPTDTANYNTANKSVNLTVTKRQVVITWNSPSPITYGTPLGNTQLNAAATYNGVAVPGTFAYSPPLGHVLQGGSNTLGVIFTPTNLSGYNGTTKTVNITVNKATPGLTWQPTVTKIINGEDWQAGHLNATASVPGVKTYKLLPGGEPVTVGGELDVEAEVTSVTVRVTFTPTANNNYNTVEIDRVFGVNQDRLTLNNNNRNGSKIVSFSGGGQYAASVNLYANVAWRIYKASGDDFDLKIDNQAVSFPHLSSGNHVLNISANISPVQSSTTTIYEIVPESGYNLNTITLTIRHIKP